MDFPRASEISSVIFDFDGTIYDTRWLGLRLVLDHLSDNYTIGMERLVRHSLIGQDFYSHEAFEKTYYSLLQDKTGLSEGKLKLWYHQRYMPSMISLTSRYYSAREGTNDVFRRLKEKMIPFCIFSDYDYVYERLHALKIDSDLISYCTGARSALEFGCLKPATRPFRELVRAMSANPKDCLVVGDRDDTDGEGARQLGMHFIQIRTYKTKIRDKNHPVVDWDVFRDYILSEF